MVELIVKLNVNGGAGGSNKQNAIRFAVDGDVKAHMGLAVDAGRLISGSIEMIFVSRDLVQIIYCLQLTHQKDFV